jgi:hypothetical protein
MWFRAVLFVAFSVLFATSARAQSDISQTIEGTVRDFTGAVMVSADVVVTSPLGERHAALTDEAGRFAFRNLPRGTYRVAASAPGFAEAAQTISVGSTPLSPVDLTLQLAVAEHVEVSAETVLAASTGLMSTTLTGKALEALPDDPGGLLQRVRELAGATDNSPFSIRVDGFEQLLWAPPKQAIQAIRISSNWFAAEYAEPGSARVDIITKPGTNRFRGDVRANFNNQAMNASNAMSPQQPSGQMREVTGYVSGPVIPNRMSFVAYRGYWSQQQGHVIKAAVLDPSYAITPHVDTIVEPSRVDNTWVGTTFQVTPLHTLALSFSDTASRARNLGLDSGVDLAERAYRRKTSNRALRGTLTSVPSTRAMNELRMQINPQRSSVQADSPAAAVIVLDAFNAGGNQEALLSTTQHLNVELTDEVTLFVPRHTLKAGIHARSADRRYMDAANAGGTFLFGADFERNATGAPVEDATGQRLVISPLERYRRTVLGLPGYGPSQYWMTRGDTDVAFRQASVGAFAQDDWIVAPRLSTSYGLRSEWQSASSALDIGLRAGAALAIDSERKNVVRGGVGTFFQRIEPELTLDIMRFDGSHQEQVLVDRPSFFPTVPSDVASASTSLPTRYIADAELRAPGILMSAASYERELTSRNFLTLKYSYQYGTALLRARNINAPDLTGDRPDPRYARVLQYESSGQLRRHELTSGWRWNHDDRRTVFANYSYVHGRSDTDGRTTVPADGSRLDREWGPIAGQRAHQANLGAHFTLPSELNVSPYLTAASGHVFNVTTGLDDNGDGVFADRPAIVLPNTPGAIQTLYGTFLVDPPAGATIVGRNAGRDPAMVRVDLRISRAFASHTGGSVVVAANFENLLNRANLERVNGVATAPTFGEPKRAGQPRRINLAASFSF